MLKYKILTKAEPLCYTITYYSQDLLRLDVFFYSKLGIIKLYFQFLD